MAFLIRTIDFTAAGREIIRDRVVEQNSLTIGRRVDPHMVLFDREIGQVNVVLGRAAHGEAGLVERPVAHDLAPGGGEVDGADQERHRRRLLLTSSRTR